MQTIRFLVLFVVLTLKKCHLLPTIEEDAINKALLMLDAMDFIKENCPVAEEYDDILICYCSAADRCIKQDFVTCLVMMSISINEAVGYIEAACPKDKKFTPAIEATDVPHIKIDFPIKPTVRKCECPFL